MASAAEPRPKFGPRLPAVVLVIVIAWALVAVMLLTGTLINAREIDHRVTEVNRQYDPIHSHTAFIALAGRTARLTHGIRLAAAPLPGELNQVIGAANQIDNRVASIVNAAASINGEVNGIDSAAHSINGTVGAIDASVRSIHGRADSIGANVASIHNRVATVFDAVGPIGSGGTTINTDVTGIYAHLERTETTARAIRHGVIAINDRARTIIALVALLKADFDSIDGVVGTSINTPTILGHANSIDCSTVLNAARPTQDCQRTP